MYDRFVEKFGTDRITLWRGDVFSVGQPARDFLEGDNARIRGDLFVYRHKFEANTGIDCSDFFVDLKRQYLSMQATLEDFLESGPDTRFDPGVRYFFGHRIPGLLAMSCPVTVVLTQHAEETAFLWHLRAAAVSEPHYDLPSLARLDNRVEAHLDGLRVAGDHGWQFALEQLEAHPEPGETFACADLAFISAGTRAALAVARYRPRRLARRRRVPWPRQSAGSPTSDRRPIMCCSLGCRMSQSPGESAWLCQRSGDSRPVPSFSAVDRQGSWRSGKGGAGRRRARGRESGRDAPPARQFHRLGDTLLGRLVARSFVGRVVRHGRAADDCPDRNKVPLPRS